MLEELQRLAFSSISDVLEVKDGHRVVREQSELDRDTLSTVASIEEVVNEKGYSTLRIKQYDRLAALTTLGRLLGMFVNKTELSGPGGSSVQVDHVATANASSAARRNRQATTRADRTADDLGN